MSKVQSVTEITRSIKGLLETSFSFAAVCGEVSNLKQPYSGHLYFTLKDQGAQLRAVMFKTQRRYLSEAFADGARIICRGRLSVYEPRGEYQLIVDSVEGAGLGDRLAAYEQLKEKLFREGLFDSERKRKLPLLPEGIALITSPRGAAVHDFLTIAARRFPSVPIEIVPVAVQGEGAVAEIIAAIRLTCQRARAGVIVICRGGGSVEDLSPFNCEELARTVGQASIPVVSAIGHEIDFTILDFVADCRAPTPTAAAEMVLPDRGQLCTTVRQYTARQRAVVVGSMAQLRHRLTLQTRLLGDPTRVVETFRMRIDFLVSRMRRGVDSQLKQGVQRVEKMRGVVVRYDPNLLVARHETAVAILRQRLLDLEQRFLERRRARLEQCTAILRSVSPQAVLERGYAIAQMLPGGDIVKSVGTVSCGDRLSLKLCDGSVVCRVDEDLVP
ncbi:MAG: exodeoxyribonuclease VII large subunit [Desulfobulbaceae bacterium]|nr:exodeoxyribonuclease VII large subunit [Desulfobulbaceae bacterium]